MPQLSAVICTQCGASIEYDPTQDEIICQYCKTQYNEYTEGDASIQSLLQYAYILLKNKEYIKADSVLDRILERNPQSHSAYWGKLLASLKIPDDSDAAIKKILNCNIPPKTDQEVHDYVMRICNVYFNNAVQFAPDHKKTEYLDWQKKLTEAVNRFKDKYLSVHALHVKLEAEKESIRSIERELGNMRKEKDTSKNNLTMFKYPYFILLLPISIIVMVNLNSGFAPTFFILIINIAIIIYMKRTKQKIETLEADILQITNNLLTKEENLKKMKRHFKDQVSSAPIFITLFN